VLVVEVSDSSLGLDRELKGSLYARAGLDDYWVVNVEERVLEIYRKPVADPAAIYGWRYASRAVFGPDASASPLASPTAAIVVHALLP
jgi:Uma2 family endonuclease